MDPRALWHTDRCGSGNGTIGPIFALSLEQIGGFDHEQQEICPASWVPFSRSSICMPPEKVNALACMMGLRQVQTSLAFGSSGICLHGLF